MSRNNWNDPWDRPQKRDSWIPVETAPPKTIPQQQEQDPEPQAVPTAGEEEGMPPPYVYPREKQGKGCMLAVVLALIIVLLTGILTVQIVIRSGLLDERLLEEFLYEFGLDEGEDMDVDQGDNTQEDDSKASDEDSSQIVTSDSEDEAQSYLERAETGVDVSIELVSWADMDELTYEEVYARNIASVVSIICYETSYSGSTGTGIIIHEDGYIVTNEHVIEDATICYVILEDNSYYEASLVGMDAESDLAVLKIEATGLTAAQFGDSNELVVGNSCVAIGDPLGVDFRGTMTTGIISALNRNVEVNGYTMTLIQTDCAINSGNSGGPLINMYGLVVGICNMKMMSSATTVEGLGFAIPSNTIKTVVNKLIATGEVQKAMLGITAQTLTTAQCQSYGIECGILVVTVSESSDAYAQGIQAGDIIVAAEGVAISTVSELNALKGDMYPGDSITLTVLRDGKYTDYLVLLMAEDAVY